MEKELRAREIALECSVFVFFIVALVGLAAGAESYVAVLRGVGAAALVAFAGRFPVRIVLEAATPSAEEAEDEGAQAPAQEAPGSSRRQRAA